MTFWKSANRLVISSSQKHVLVVFALQPVFHQRIERLHVNVIGSYYSNRPGLLHFVHKGFVEVLGFLPQGIEPADQLSVIVVSSNTWP